MLIQSDEVPEYLIHDTARASYGISSSSVQQPSGELSVQT